MTGIVFIQWDETVFQVERNGIGVCVYSQKAASCLVVGYEIALDKFDKVRTKMQTLSYVVHSQSAQLPGRIALQALLVHKAVLAETVELDLALEVA